jgi:hypothetical protein
MKMKSILLIAALVIASVSVDAQVRNSNSNRKSEKQQAQITQRSKTSKGEGRTVTVQSQPAKSINKVNRNQVEYRSKKPKVVAVRSQGYSNASVIKKDNKDYYYQSGSYYRKYNDNYVKVAPPVGLSVRLLPEGSLRIVIGNRSYFYFEGVYYITAGDGYVVETPPVGAIVYALPADYERVEVNGELYYEYNGILYSKVNYQGDRAYQVVGYLD